MHPWDKFELSGLKTYKTVVSHYGNGSQLQQDSIWYKIKFTRPL